MQQVRRLEKRGYTVLEEYKLPTVKELKTLSPGEQSHYIRRAAQIKTKTVRTSSYKKKRKKTEEGKYRTQKVKYKKAVHEEKSIAAKKAAKTRKKPIKRPVQTHRKAGELTKAERERRAEGLDEVFETAMQAFLDTVPEDKYYDAEAYVQELREGHDVGSFEEFLADLDEAPSARETFDIKMENLDQVSPEVADYMRSQLDKYIRNYGEDTINDRFASAREIPDFDVPYESLAGGHTVGYGAIARMLEIIKGAPISGAEARALSKALLKDEYL